jgi:hypothetical protein
MRRRLLVVFVVLATFVAVGGWLSLVLAHEEHPPAVPAHEEDPPAVTQCSDGVDNDQDGATDAFDRDCEGPADLHESGSDEPECSDGIDNDGDGKIDFGSDPDHNDPDCESDDDDSEGTPPSAHEICDNGIDDDGDGKIDGADPDCQPGTEGPAGDPTCSDGIDNDGDGLTDGADPDCQRAQTECSDGIDNDGDGKVDFDGGPEQAAPDEGCTDGSDPLETTTCENDYDGDGSPHSNFFTGGDETGLVTGIVHPVDQALPGPLGADGGLVSEVNCLVGSILPGTL